MSAFAQTEAIEKSAVVGLTEEVQDAEELH
jgi:hypothetical protein